ncbi:MAG: transporter substrate-binding domain-containing protein, partial [Prochloraceae cyanobacterium]
VEYRHLSSVQRFTAVQSGEVDLLSRNTTWTISRNTSVGMEFAPTIFYDGQGIMVGSKSGIKKLEQLQGKTICVKSGTTTELNLADRMNQKGIDYNPVVFGDEDTLFNSYLQGRCEAISADRTQLVGRRVIFSNPEEHVILDTVLSKEPLSPVVATGDSKWFNSVKWITYALIQAEELGINSSNLDTFMSSQDPSIKRFLGLEGSLGKDMGLPNNFTARIVKHVGNYGEIYSRNFDDTFHIDRGLNQLWSKGGLLYAPPFR